MRGGRWLVALVMAAIVVGLGYLGYEAYRGSEGEECYACQRAIHAHSRTVGLLNGHPVVFCCPACALSEHEQDGKPIRVTELTGFLTGKKLSPDEAYLVRGSDVNMCARTRELTDADKRQADVQYDRCSPSLLAFARQEDAAQFAREHGGEVVPFREIVSAFGR